MITTSGLLEAHAMPRFTKLVGALLAFAMLSGGVRAQTAVANSPPAVRVEPAANSDASEDATELAKKLQNPIGDLYSVPFQNNTNFNYGPNKGTQNILNIQPVIPIHVNDEWNVITRTILPLVWSPSLQPARVSRSALRRRAFRHFSRRRTRWMAGSGASGPIAESADGQPARRWAPTCGASVRPRWWSSS